MGSVVVLEASGGYERPLTFALAEAGVAYARINPWPSAGIRAVLGETGQNRPGGRADFGAAGAGFGAKTDAATDKDRAHLA